VSGLDVSFVSGRHKVPVLQDITLSLDAGQTLGIVGESGSGKSMLGLAITRLLPAAARVASGTVVLDGRDLLALSEREMRGVRGSGIGTIFQDPRSSLNPSRQIGAQLVEAVRRGREMSREEAHRRAVELLDEVQISRPAERMKAYPFELSGGMCQRVVIAMAVARNPTLVIADEPTTALDARVEMQVLNLLADLKHHYRMAMILISHDMRVMSRVADEVAVMYAGEIVESAGVDTLFGQPAHPYTRGLLDSAPFEDNPNVRRERLPTIAGSPPRIGHWLGGCRFADRCPYASDADTCRTAHPSLDVVGPGHLARTAHPLVTTEGTSHA